MIMYEAIRVQTISRVIETCTQGVSLFLNLQNTQMLSSMILAQMFQARTSDSLARMQVVTQSHGIYGWRE